MSVKIKVTTQESINYIEYTTWDDYIKIRDTIVLHSYNNNPAVIEYYDDGSISSQEWYNLGKISRASLPAVINFCEDGTIRYCEFFFENKEIIKDTSIKYPILHGITIQLAELLNKI